MGWNTRFGVCMRSSTWQLVSPTRCPICRGKGEPEKTWRLVEQPSHAESLHTEKEIPPISASVPSTSLCDLLWASHDRERMFRSSWFSSAWTQFARPRLRCGWEGCTCTHIKIWSSFLNDPLCFFGALRVHESGDLKQHPKENHCEPRHPFPFLNDKKAGELRTHTKVKPSFVHTRACVRVCMCVVCVWESNGATDTRTERQTQVGMLSLCQKSFYQPCRSGLRSPVGIGSSPQGKEQMAPPEVFLHSRSLVPSLSSEESTKRFYVSLWLCTGGAACCHPWCRPTESGDRCDFLLPFVCVPEIMIVSLTLVILDLTVVTTRLSPMLPIQKICNGEKYFEGRREQDAQKARDA